jgi:hypothetical protein
VFQPRTPGIQNEHWYWVNHFEPEKADLSSRSIMQSMDVTIYRAFEARNERFQKSFLNHRLTAKEMTDRHRTDCVIW